jgi:hypothetical protein
VRGTETGMIGAVRRGIVQGLDEEDRRVSLDFIQRVMDHGPAIGESGADRITYRNLFCQTYQGFDHLSAGAMLLQLHGDLHVGLAAVVSVLVGFAPEADAAWEDNAAALRNGLALREPARDFWRGEVWPSSTQGADGEITWDHEFPGSPNSLNSDAFGRVRSAPLEIGYMHPLQLAVRWVDSLGVVARWPYGSKYVYLIGQVARHAALWNEDAAAEFDAEFHARLAALAGHACAT